MDEITECKRSDKVNEVELIYNHCTMIEVHHLLRTHLCEWPYRDGILSPELKPCPSTITHLYCRQHQANDHWGFDPKALCGQSW